MTNDNQDSAMTLNQKFSLSILSQSLALLVPLLYLTGYSYRMGWLTGLGLEESVAPLSVDGYIRSGYFALISFGSEFANRFTSNVLIQWVLISASIGAALFIFFWLLYLMRSAAVKATEWLEDKRRRASFATRNSVIVALMTFFIGTLPAVGLVLFYLLLIPALLPYRQGEVEAKRTWDQVSKTNNPFPIAAFLNEENVRFSHTLIECEGEGCVVFDGTRFSVVARDSVRQICGNIVSGQVASDAKPTRVCSFGTPK